MGERRSSRRMAGVLTYEMGILVWDPEDEPTGTVANVNSSSKRTNSSTTAAAQNLNP